MPIARLRAGGATLCLLAFLSMAAAPSAPAAQQWPSAGQNPSNTHNNAAEDELTTKNASKLGVKWTYQTHGDVSATPAVAGGYVYFPDWGGRLNKVNAKTGREAWSIRIDSLAGEPPGAVSRTGPAVDNGTVYIGDQNGAHLLAIDAATGALKWSTQLDTHPLAILTESPVVVDGVIYEGVASLEEAAASDPNYPCCNFVGSMNAVRASDGQLLWRTNVIPDNHGALDQYSGGGVWGSTAAVDRSSHTVYFATGNNYSVPQSAKDCQTNGGTNCAAPDDHVDAVLAADTATGAIKWAFHAQPGLDDWNVACVFGSPHNCPDNPGPDYDFGSGPNLLTVNTGNTSRKLVGVGQKSGAYWALDAATGAVVWKNFAGPGSTLGGIEWGSATDGKRVYIAEANFYGIPYQLPNGQTITSGSFAALDPATGDTIWQIADPSGSQDLGALSSANGIVFAGSMSGTMYAIEAATGHVLWSFAGAGSSIAGPAIVDGTVYWGNGYAHLGIPGYTGSTTFYAFATK
jgi:polyvinyl alcohol dehydrogenase (cytochrome)